MWRARVGLVYSHACIRDSDVLLSKVQEQSVEIRPLPTPSAVVCRKTPTIHNAEALRTSDARRSVVVEGNRKSSEFLDDVCEIFCGYLHSSLQRKKLQPEPEKKCSK
jgi:hypothetical protein